MTIDTNKFTTKKWIIIFILLYLYHVVYTIGFELFLKYTHQCFN